MEVFGRAKEVGFIWKSLFYLYYFANKELDFEMDLVFSTDKWTL